MVTFFHFIDYRINRKPLPLINAKSLRKPDLTRRVFRYGSDRLAGATRTTYRRAKQHAERKAVLTIRRADFTRKAGDFPRSVRSELHTTHLFLTNWMYTSCGAHRGRQETRDV